MTNSNPVSDELAHITQEMYKKNLELANKNKALSLLRQVDAIILGSVSEITQIAQEVAEVVVNEGGAQLLSLYEVEERGTQARVLHTAVSQQTDTLLSFSPFQKGNIVYFKDSLEGLRVVVESKEEKTYSELKDIFPYIDGNICKQVQEDQKIDMFFAYPLISRNTVVGIMIVGIQGKQEVVEQYRQDVLDRLSSVVSVAVENALLYQELRIANQKLKELDKLKDEFVSVASHELRTPLTAIRSYLWMAIEGKGGPLSEKQKYYLDRSYNSTIRLIKLVNDMLNISRIESGRMEFDMKKIDMNALIQEVITEVKPRADELKLRIESVMKQEPLFVVGDSDKLHEVLLNIIGNSLKFTPPNGTITIASQQKDNHYHILVTDTGVGIEKEDISRLFQKFGMIQGSYVTNQAAAQGTGLGLYICKSIMQKHGGDIWVDSPGRNKGTTFSFSLLPYSSEQETKLKGNVSNSGLGLIHSNV